MDDTAAICNWMDLLAGNAERCAGQKVGITRRSSRSSCVPTRTFILSLACDRRRLRFWNSNLRLAFAANWLDRLARFFQNLVSPDGLEAGGGNLPR
jgi:hypothetical protein